jgi:peptidoglycan L-alanyl-D-glutamate endopeptidase CwlK
VSSRKITDCHPVLQSLVQRFLENCTRAGLDVLITCTWRSPEEQSALYAQGRTKPGKIVTNAQAGQSAHNYVLNGLPAALAIDVVPLRNGKPVWGLAGDGIDDNPADDERDDLELWQQVVKAGEDAGLVSASRWPSFREYPHFEHARWREIKAVK